MKTGSAVLAVGGVALVVAAAYAAYSIGMQSGMAMASATNTSAATSATSAPATGADGSRVLYWHDPMVPAQRFDKPGKSPFMDMPLVPVYAESAGDAGVRIDPRIQQNLGVRTAQVTPGSLQGALEANGNVAYNERDVALVQARSNGYVERLLVRAPLDAVKRGQPLAELYVPDWVGAQEEFLAVRRMAAQAPPGLVDAARQRMRLVGMSDAQVALVDSTGTTHPRLTVTSPLDGVVTELAAREGMTVATGAPLFRINGLQTVWINAEIPEAAASQVRPGASVDITTSAYPQKSFTGKVTALLPEVNAATRTLKARIEVGNPGHLLTPGMFASIRFAATTGGQVLLVPSEAIIRTGKRNVVMVAREQGRFEPVEVDVGAESGGQSEIRRGVSAGDKVVVSGQFALDSEASLKGFGPQLK